VVSTKVFIQKVSAISEPSIDDLSVKLAKQKYAEFRETQGFKKAVSNLLTPPEANLKLSKGVVLNYGLSLAPAKVSGVINVCVYSTKGCRDLCINTSGNGNYPNTQLGRISKTKFFTEDPQAFLTLLKYEISNVKTKAEALEQKLAFRLNVFSDLPWEKMTPWLFKAFPDIQFYDYTKYPDRFDSLPKNYHLTYSASERNSDEDIKNLLRKKVNVTVVADKVNGQVPTTWNRFKVHDGDVNDYRPADPKGVIVFLKPKGRAISKTKAPRGGFIRTTEGFKV
jgi:hypothetical protein